MPDLTFSISCNVRRWRVTECEVLLLAKSCKGVLRKSRFKRDENSEESPKLEKVTTLTFPTEVNLEQFKIFLFADVKFDSIVIET